MAIRKILTEGDQTLYRKSRPVKTFDDHLKQLVDDLFETMYDDDGVGLAAPQVGVLKRLFVIDVGDEHGPLAFVNPELIEMKGEQTGPEGCLSLPGLFGIVKRPLNVRVRAQDVDGNIFEKELTALGARCVCHESDHLDGILFRRRSEIPLCDFDALPVQKDDGGSSAEEKGEACRKEQENE